MKPFPDAVPYRLVALDVPDAGVLRVLIVAEDPLVRAGLATLLADGDGYALAGTAPLVDALAEAVDAFEADVALCDVGFGETPSANLAALQDLDLPTVALLPDVGLAAEAWSAGAHGLLLRNQDADAILAALFAVYQGLVALDPALTDDLLVLREPLPPAQPLTPREHEVLGLLAEGLPNKLIADRLQISENTVKYHVGAIFGKLGAQSRTEAVMQAARLGLVVV